MSQQGHHPWFSQSASSSPPPQIKSFAGPSGRLARYASWDSGMLELHSDESFIFELWCHHESWSYRHTPEDTQSRKREIARTSTDADVSNEGNQVHTFAETRVTFTGVFSSETAVAVEISGLQKKELNQVFIQDTRLPIGGKPSWWSIDGCYFVYFAEDYMHWKVNAVRASGGDGIRAVQLGRKRAGCGFAHSGPIDETHPAAAILCADGWFECLADEWEPVAVKVTDAQACAITFSASQAVVMDRQKQGEAATFENRVCGPMTFTGWHTGSDRGDFRILLPAALEPLKEGALSLVDDAVDMETSGIGFLGDPDFFILHPPTSKL